MSHKNTIDCNIVIIGAGIVGLWLLARFKTLGYNTLLLESNAIGAGQTGHAQGIIHGGIKYSLRGSGSQTADAVSDMPQLWNKIAAGDNNLNIDRIKRLSSYQLMWSTESLTSRLTALFASHLTRTRSCLLRSNDRPKIFNHEHFKGSVYKVEEPVIDVTDLLHSLATPHLQSILHIQKIEKISDLLSGKKQITLTTAKSSTYRIDANMVILAAGKGNSTLLDLANHNLPQMQLRPLRMLMVRGALPELYAHCLGLSDKPRVTITTHYDRDNNVVWYVGGQLAEDGADRDEMDLIAYAKIEFKNLFPWMDIERLQWATVYIERAEHRQNRLTLPNSYFIHDQNRLITVWPTKMALTPLLVNDMVKMVQKYTIPPSSQIQHSDWPIPPFSRLPWDENIIWS